jgi:hypothetical protein
LYVNRVLMNGIKEPRKQIRINRIKQTPFDGRVLDEVFATHLKQKKNNVRILHRSVHTDIFIHLASIPRPDEWPTGLFLSGRDEIFRG